MFSNSILYFCYIANIVKKIIDVITRALDSDQTSKIILETRSKWDLLDKARYWPLKDFEFQNGGVSCFALGDG